MGAGSVGGDSYLRVDGGLGMYACSQVLAMHVYDLLARCLMDEPLGLVFAVCVCGCVQVVCAEQSVCESPSYTHAHDGITRHTHTVCDCVHVYIP